MWKSLLLHACWKRHYSTSLKIYSENKICNIVIANKLWFRFWRKYLLSINKAQVKPDAKHHTCILHVIYCIHWKKLEISPMERPLKVKPTYICNNGKNISAILNAGRVISWPSHTSFMVVRRLHLECAQPLTISKLSRIDTVKYRNDGKSRLPHEEELVQTPCWFCVFQIKDGHMDRCSKNSTDYLRRKIESPFQLLFV